jgi:hypothetical protein
MPLIKTVSKAADNLMTLTVTALSKVNASDPSGFTYLFKN